MVLISPQIHSAMACPTCLCHQDPETSDCNDVSSWTFCRYAVCAGPATSTSIILIISAIFTALSHHVWHSLLRTGLSRAEWCLQSDVMPDVRLQDTASRAARSRSWQSENAGGPAGCALGTMARHARCLPTKHAHPATQPPSHPPSHPATHADRPPATTSCGDEGRGDDSNYGQITERKKKNLPSLVLHYV